ncbi:transcriptional repressor LexA [Marinitenerispora sediminis]|uniref:LexA repressor n=1 Tax=Marinitenerispora sediminis TaxID=1931232 RepID=A0A368TAT0_9ACTN|nr:transcriptional repressor LexA [Marinitenerispora sediminis]RCV56961.1 repressor LexA [Marinitenerispora sediminis]RCV60166.1 repressor LexA [Marinitenerispora sediminis]RCV62128.1 repressor LexA [Marinitenerispora sediminis]
MPEENHGAQEPHASGKAVTALRSSSTRTRAAQEPAAPSDSAPKLTARQQSVLNVIHRYVRQRGYPPSIREIGDAVGLSSPSSVAHQLKVLQRKGYLHRDQNRPRAVEIRIPGQPPVRSWDELDEDHSAAPGRATDVPVIGRIAAGGPILAEEAVEDVLTLPKQLVGEGRLFMLTVVGDSMIEAAITDGDLVVVRQQPDANNGDIVAALLGDEATVKAFRRDGDHVWLMPRNPEYEPIRGDEATILGKVVAVLRRV